MVVLASPPMNGSNTTPMTYWVFFVLALSLLLHTLVWTFWIAPVEAYMGVVQKIFYFHVPAAMAMQALFITCGITSIVFLFRPGPRSDRLAVSCAEVGVLMGAFVLITGPIWARKAWNHWWEWEPRLVLTMVIFLLYMAYLALRRYAGTDSLTKRIGAGLAALGLPGIYLVRVAVERWRGTHPQVIYKGGLEDVNMQIAFGLGVAAFACLSVVLVWRRYALQRSRDDLEALTMTMMEHDLLEEEL